MKDIWILFETKKKKKNEDRIIRDNRTLFDTSKEERKKKQNERKIKDVIIRAFGILFEQEREED